MNPLVIYGEEWWPTFTDRFENGEWRRTIHPDRLVNRCGVVLAIR